MPYFKELSMNKNILGRMAFNQRTVIFCFLLSQILSCTVAGGPCFAGIIFQENFNAQADWNASNQLSGVEGSPPTSKAPPNWSFFRSIPGAAGLNPCVSIRQLPKGVSDHMGGTGGKALVIYNESINNANWPGDGILGRYFGPTANYQELYVRFWLRTQPRWQTIAGAQSKIFRVLHWDGGDNIFQFFPTGQSAPIYLWDLITMGSSSSGANKAGYQSAYRGDPQETNYYLSASGQWYETTDYYFGWNGKVGRTLADTTFRPWVNPHDPGIYADGQWHRYDFHLKLNDIGQANGIMEFSYDDTLKESHDDVVWKTSGARADIGWNVVAFGGNSNNTFSSTNAEQWYAIDDIVISTTPIPAEYAIDNGGSSKPIRSLR